MSEVTREWVTTGFFLVMVVVTILLEVLWLMRRAWTTSGKAAAFVLLSDLLGMSIGWFVTFVVIGVMLMAAFSGDLGQVPGGDTTLWFALVFAIVFPLLLLFFLKRVLLALFKIRASSSAWVYAAAASALVILLPIIPSAAFFYALGYIR